MSHSEPLPVTLIAQCMSQLHAIANVLRPTEPMQASVENGTAQVQFKQYVCGTEHLELAISYLEHAIGVTTTPTEPSESLNEDPELGYERSVRHVKTQWEPSATATDETPLTDA